MAMPAHQASACWQDLTCQSKASGASGKIRNLDSGLPGPQLLAALQPATAGAAVVHFPDVRGLQLPFESSWHAER